MLIGPLISPLIRMFKLSYLSTHLLSATTSHYQVLPMCFAADFVLGIFILIFFLRSFLMSPTFTNLIKEAWACVEKFGMTSQNMSAGYAPLAGDTDLPWSY